MDGVEPIWADVSRYDGQRDGLVRFCQSIAGIALVDSPVNIQSIVRDHSDERNIVLDRLSPGQWFGSDMKTWAAVILCVNEGPYATRKRWVRTYDLLICFGLPIWRYIETDRTGPRLRFRRTPRAVAIDRAGPRWRPTPHRGRKITATLVERIESDMIDGLGLDTIATKYDVARHVVQSVAKAEEEEIKELRATFGGPGVDKVV